MSGMFLQLALSQQAKASQQAAAQQQQSQQQPTQPAQQQPTQQYSSGPHAMPSDPQTTVVRQTPPNTSNPQGQIWLRSDYHVENVQTTPTSDGGSRTTYVFAPNQTEPVEQTPTRLTSALKNNILFGGKNIPVGSTPFGGQPLLNTSEKQSMALSLITMVAAPFAGPALVTALTARGVILGEAAGVGLSQVMKAGQGGGLLTPQEIVSSAAMGGAFSVVGGSLIQSAGLAGKAGLAGVAGRVGMNTVLGGGAGAGIEYVQTGKVTARNVIVGAAFGAGMGAVGELGSMGGEGFRSKIAQSNFGQRTQATMNAKYYNAENVSDLHRSMPERIISGVTGIKPQKPAFEVSTMKTIETAPKDSYMNYKVTKDVEMDSTIFISKTPRSGKPYIEEIVTPQETTGNRVPSKPTNMSENFGLSKQETSGLKGTTPGKRTIDSITFKEQVPVTKEYRMEMADAIEKPNSARSAAMKYNILDENTMLFGKSVAPTPKSQTMKTADVGELTGRVKTSPAMSNVSEQVKFGQSEVDADINQQVGKFGATGKQQAEIANKVMFNEKKFSVKGDFPEGKTLSPSKMSGERTKAFQFAGSPKDLETSMEYTTPDGAKIGNFARPKQYDMSELKKNIGNFEKIPKGDAYTDSQIKWKQLESPSQDSKGDFMYRETKAPKTPKAGKMNEQELSMANELTGKNQGVSGPETVFQEMRMGTERAKIYAPTKTQSQARNPFVGVAGRSYYGQQYKQGAEESEVVYTNYPNSGLNHPVSPGKLDTQNSNLGSTGALGLGNIGSGFTGMKEPTKLRFGSGGVSTIRTSNPTTYSPALKGKTRQETRTNSIALTTGLNQNLQQGVNPIQGIGGIFGVGQSPKPIQAIKPVQDTTQTPKQYSPDTLDFNAQRYSSKFALPELKYEGKGFGSPTGGKASALDKRIRYYSIASPIAVAKEMF
jgi:hypothetical protein